MVNKIIAKFRIGDKVKISIRSEVYHQDYAKYQGYVSPVRKLQISLLSYRTKYGVQNNKVT